MPLAFVDSAPSCQRTDARMGASVPGRSDDLGFSVATLMYAVTLRAWITYAIVALALIGACSRRWRFQIQDKVIQTENNYEKEVFNGDIGTIESIDPIEHEVSIRFDNRLVNYDFGELDEVSLAYAVTIHKSQGSKFPAVVIPLATQHYVLLQRNLIYTGVTRGKRACRRTLPPRAVDASQTPFLGPAAERPLEDRLATHQSWWVMPDF